MFATRQQSASAMGVAITIPQMGIKLFRINISGISTTPFRKIARKKDFLPSPVAWKKVIKV
jgi:hypothetical protein